MRWRATVAAALILPATAVAATPDPRLAPDQARIYRDSRGVPHIYAGSDEAGYALLAMR
jgi:acyl-homoserine lactone acylase PvdQ